MMFDELLSSSLLDEDVEFMPLISLEEEDDQKQIEYPGVIPVLPLRNTVLYPGVVLPITVGRDKSIKAIQSAIGENKLIGVISQKDAKTENPSGEDLHTVGTIAKIVKKLKMPDGSNTVIIQGKRRFQIQEILSEDPYMKASIQVLEENKISDEKEFLATVSSLKDLAAKIIQLSPNIPSEAAVVMRNIDSPAFLVHFIASNLSNDNSEKQKILETEDLMERAQLVLKHLHNELQILELKNQIQSKVKTDIEKQQRDYFLSQQLKTIQEELGGDVYDQEIKNLRKRAARMKWDKPVADAFNKDLEKLGRINPSAAEYSVLLNYLELLLELPWNIYTKDNFNLKRAEKILDQDHFGMKKVKKRLLEYLAVLKLKGDLKSPILCLVGPPGVGKTSLGRSIARALNRKYVRMSLGGLHDESEIRGHRKTYIGAMPGRVIQSLKKVKSSNPVFILDEIDKVGADFRGDPSSALLEVLDPEQNNSFYDNFLELEYDLSKTLFIATANNLNSIQPALRDRMEIIYLNGYSTEEKVEIATRHLIPKQREAHGLTAKNVRLSRKVLTRIIEGYTRESGVRELDRTLAAVMRHVAKEVAMEEGGRHAIKIADLKDILGVEKFEKDQYTGIHPPGVSIGLAWTAVGGEILFIETALSKGKGNLTLTGNLGDVMKESATTALTFIKTHSDQLGLDPEVFDQKNVHIHVPEGAIPKDGPSAGITILTSLCSAFTNRQVEPHLAMTGEITLRGKVLPVGGIKEKILAAKRAGITDVMLCKRNEKDVEEISKEYLKGMNFIYVDNMMDVIRKVLI